MRFRNLIALTTITIAATGSAPAAAFGQTSFEGQTIRLSVNATPSSASDLFGRLVAPAIANRIPGHPTVVVENRPGAGGMVAANQFFNAVKPDGLTIGLFFGVVTSGLVGGDNIRFAPTKFQWLGAVAATQVLLARKDLRLSTPRDMLKPAAPLVLAGTPNSSNDVANRLFLDMLGAKYKSVSGFPGQPEQILALTRGEVNLAVAALPIYLSRRDAIRHEGLYDAIVQRGELGLDGRFLRNASISELPTMVEVIEQANPAALKSVEFAAYRSIVGAFRLNWGFLLPPGADEATVRTLRTAIGAALSDPHVREQARQSLRTDYDFVDGEATASLLARLAREFDADPRIGALIRELMMRK